MENTKPCADTARPSLAQHKSPRAEATLPAPRVWTIPHIAARLNRSVAWFYAHKAHLKQHGFPNKDSILGGWDSFAVEAWLDRRSGITSTANIEDEMLEAIRGSC